MRHIIFLVLFILLFSFSTFGQENTIGVLEIDTTSVSDGYVLFNPERQSTVYLINNCGEIVNTWTTDELRVPGKEQYLDSSGRLYLASIQPALQGSSFGAGGAGGVLEILDWDGNVEWQYVVADSVQRQHHDIHIMPNGNVMFIAWEKIPLEEAAEVGFDVENNPQIGFWPDKIVEVDPISNQIVWQWRTMDHMVQDIDASKENFGVISDHPELININYLDFAFGRQDVHHVNSVDYNEELDMVMISVRNFNELWIIDHSTTIEEATTHSGGLRNKGGDLLFRWGNPSAYNAGDTSDQKLFRPHDASWIDDVPHDHPYFGQISVYNNFINSEFSLGAVINPVFNNDENVFETEEKLFLPLAFTATINHPDIEKTYSPAASNIQMLPNGNVFMCAARQGRVSELTPTGSVAWEYLIPTRNGFPVSQGEELAISDNFTFSARRYAADFVGFQNKDLSPKGYVELEPNVDNCMLSVEVNEIVESKFEVFPNPIEDVMYIHVQNKGQFRILDIFGNVLKEISIDQGNTLIDLHQFSAGIYFLENTISKEVKKIVKL